MSDDLKAERNRLYRAKHSEELRRKDRERRKNQNTPAPPKPALAASVWLNWITAPPPKGDPDV